MQETTFAKQAAARVPQPLRPYWEGSDSPIYDRLEREWMRAGRTVPRPVGPPGWHRVDGKDQIGRT
ncbi:hypothetical protein OG756_33380 [Streptomyces sp. NBC_01310]|uniref:hypothetical protein n=1 Tax=unclassified Streptomyces TaxID=2593676 RepID=UPI0035B587DF|nr:hypothetical protein OG756_33380 [Streptomyces sp. NBC_01310]